MLIYLATPYSHPDKAVRSHRFQQVTIKAGELMSKGLFVFSPITHCHPIALVATLPTDWDYWQGYCRQTLTRCDELHILQLPGWEASVGVTQEISLALTLNLPIHYHQPT